VSQRVAQLVGKKKTNKFNYIHDLKEELKKVSWATKSELLLCTKIVVGTTFCFGLGIYVVDLILKNALDSLNFIIKLIS